MDVGSEFANHLLHCVGDVFFGIQGGTDGCEQMGVVQVDDMFFVQFQGADKSLLQLRQKVQRAAQKRHVSPDRLAAGKTADGLIYHSLKNGGRQVFFCGPFVDQRLDIGFSEDAAPCRDGVQGMVIFRIFVEARRIRLQQGGHLVDERTGTAGTDPVHALPPSK